MCHTAGPVQIGISAPQGCGKTTIVAELERLFVSDGHPCASVSIDDFYLSHAAQTEVSERNAANRLLQGRGNAGTHDLTLGSETLSRLRHLGCAAHLLAPSWALNEMLAEVVPIMAAPCTFSSEISAVLAQVQRKTMMPDTRCRAGETMQVPRYNKSAFAGAGDTAERAQWPAVTGTLDVILFEGWMLGFAPVGAERAAAVEPALAAVDECLSQYKDAWDAHVHTWLVVEVSDAQAVYQWRLQAEQQMRLAGNAGMSDAEVERFVSRYMPAYTAYLPGLYAHGPTTARPGHLLRVAVDENRCIKSAVAL